MAIIWERKSSAGVYQVRSAGSTIRLYKDGVFHSHYNPKHIVTRGVWDLLVLPCFLHPPSSIQRVLILGVGGGAAIHLLNHFVQPTHITAIELDPLHLRIAKRFFKVRYANTDLIEGDAIEWVHKQAARTTPQTFDLIIDDLYGEEDGEPVRAITADADWCKQLHSLLSDEGLLVSNFVTAKERRSSAYLTTASVRRQYKTRFKFNNPQYQNEILALSKQACKQSEFNARCSVHSELKSARYKRTYSVRKL